MIIELSNDKIWKFEKMNRKNILQSAITELSTKGERENTQIRHELAIMQVVLWPQSIYTL